MTRWPRMPALTVVLAGVLAGCAAGPAYQRPDVDVPAAFKPQAVEPGSPGWHPAVPGERLDPGRWWQAFGDSTLDELLARVDVSNQTMAVAAANHARALAVLAQTGAARFPSLALDGGAARSGGAARGLTSNQFQLGLAASWSPDLWGRLDASVQSARASAQASQADLAGARLSVQAALATSYFSLRAADAQMQLLRSTVAGYERSAQITRNRFDAGVAPRTDLLQAQTQLASARADLAVLRTQRDQLESSVAVLVGQPAPGYSLAAAAWVRRVVDVPLSVPSELLQRRPDIAAAERTVAAANAQIGVAQSAYYPSVALSGSAGLSSARIADLFNASSLLWSIGASVAQTLFDAGATRAGVEAAQASRDGAIASYRLTVLTAFKEVEDQLSVSAALAEQQRWLQEASQAADLTEQQVQNRYQAGQVSYTEVVVAQASALNARRSLVQLQSSRQAAAIALIQALGGGWNASALDASAASPR